MQLNPSAVEILDAIFGMGALTFAMSLWMSITRVPAMKAAGVALQEAAHTRDLAPRLPSSVRRISDNYNHLFEAPTVFYAVAVAIVIAGLADPIYAVCAWIFLAGRVCHSLVQATFNSVPIRIVFYTVSWLALAVMILRPLVTGALHA